MLSNKGMLARILLSVLIMMLVIGAHMAANAMEITLAWQLNDPSENVTYYRIYWKTTPFTNDSRPMGDNCPIEVHLTDLDNYEDFPNFDVDADSAVYSFFLEDLEGDQVYYLAVQAVSDTGTSRISNLVTTKPGKSDGGNNGDGSGCFIMTIR